MAKARPLSFHATDVEAAYGPHDVASLAFSIEGESDQPVHFSMTAEDADEGDGAVVRVGWGDGKDGCDETVVTLARVTLSRGRFELAFAEPRPAGLGPCSAVALTFDPLAPAEELQAVRALQAMAAALGDALAVPAPPAAAIVAPMGPRRVGAPILGLVASADPWRASSKSALTISLTLTNLGGALSGGVSVEIGGAALEGGLVLARSIEHAGDRVTCERRGNIASASLPLVRVPADLDVDRRADKKAPRPPTIALTLTLDAQRAGSGLLTVRMRLLGKTEGGAMVGRTAVVTD